MQHKPFLIKSCLLRFLLVLDEATKLFCWRFLFYDRMQPLIFSLQLSIISHLSITPSNNNFVVSNLWLVFGYFLASGSKNTPVFIGSILIYRIPSKVRQFVLVKKHKVKTYQIYCIQKHLLLLKWCSYK